MQNKGEGYGPHVRLGIGRRESQLNAPVGVDGYSYGIRDKTGDKIHLSQPRAYGEAFGTGDVVGVYVSLPPRPHPAITSDDRAYAADPLEPSRIVRRRVPIRYKGQLYFESMEYAPAKEMEDLAYSTKDPAGFAKAAAEAEEKKRKRNVAPPPGQKKAPALPVVPPQRPLPILETSKIAFFKNGECQGAAFEDLFDWLPLRQHAKDNHGHVPRISTATAILLARESHHDDGTLGYYPFVSVFGGGVARLNPGPHFKHEPPEDIESLISYTSALWRSHAKKPSEMSGNAGSASSKASKWRPLCERYEEYYSEMRMYDEADERSAMENFERNKDQYPAVFAASKPSGSASGSGKGVGTAKKKTALRQELMLATEVESRESTPASAPSPGSRAAYLAVPLSLPLPLLPNGIKLEQPGTPSMEASKESSMRGSGDLARYGLDEEENAVLGTKIEEREASRDETEKIVKMEVT